MKKHLVFTVVLIFQALFGGCATTHYDFGKNVTVYAETDFKPGRLEVCQEYPDKINCTYLSSSRNGKYFVYRGLLFGPRERVESPLWLKLYYNEEVIWSSYLNKDQLQVKKEIVFYIDQDDMKGLDSED